MILSNDSELINVITDANIFSVEKFIFYNESSDPLDVLSTVFSENPTLLIADDDFLRPQSIHILRSIKKIKKNIYIIFLFSDLDFDLGREMSQLGVHYYTHKPLSITELSGVLNSIAQLKAKDNGYNRY